jgi:hypothetical protein
MAAAHSPISAEHEAERQELQAVLQSGILDRAPNLRRFLEYVAEQHFAGTTDQVKEYSIAVQALHRLEQFDPQSDTIVRVTAHTLRKKLEQYYAKEGADHIIQIRLPAGKYLLQFEHKEQASMLNADPVELVPALTAPTRSMLGSQRPAKLIWAALGTAGAVLVLLGITYWMHRQQKANGLLPAAQPGSNQESAEAAAASRVDSVRIRFGATTRPYVDVAGQIWQSDQYCKGGATFSHPNHEIQGTDDPALFEEGREGKFQCRIPVPPRTYQLQLLFADTGGDKEAARQVDVSINNETVAALDIVDEASGDNIVVGKVYGGIHPMSDGTIHLDFTSEGSFVNAAELTPTESDAGLPMRMLAGPAVFHEENGNTWLPERFFQGGRRTFHTSNVREAESSRLFEWARYGHFHYFIPVIAGKVYRVRLYFSEGWFGSSNGGPGGVGSRVFDVYCNGTTLLKGFDILEDQKNGWVVKTFNHVKPTAHGMLEIYFTPVKNYPLINAIEIEPEG